MTTLILGFVGIVLLPALITSMIIGRANKTPAELYLQDDNMRFKISSDA